MRINKFLAQCGLGSRRKVESLIIDKKILINNQVITNLSYDVKECDIVKFENKILKPSDDKVYIMLNKPKCYICSSSDENGRKIVGDLIKIKEKIFNVGRLDYNTEGLLLLTNDGDFANSIIHPSKHINKTYEVILKSKPTPNEINLIRNGIIIDGVKTLPAIVSKIENLENSYRLYITIFEGKNREIRNIFSSVHHKILNLKRVAIGGLELGNLQVGKYKFLNNNDLNKIFER